MGHLQPHKISRHSCIWTWSAKSRGFVMWTTQIWQIWFLTSGRTPRLLPTCSKCISHFSISLKNDQCNELWSFFSEMETCQWVLKIIWRKLASKRVFRKKKHWMLLLKAFQRGFHESELTKLQVILSKCPDNHTRFSLGDSKKSSKSELQTCSDFMRVTGTWISSS